MFADKNEAGLKIFLLAYVSDPQSVPEYQDWTKQQIRAYRQRVLEECERQRANNPIAVTIMRGIPGISLTDLGEVMRNMQRLYANYEEWKATHED